MHPKVFLHASRNNLRQTCFFSSFRFCYYEFTRSLFFFFIMLSLVQTTR